MFCIHCGAQLQADHRFCRSCGKSAGGSPPATPADGRVAGQVRTLSVCWIAFSAVQLLRGGGRLLGARVIRIVGHDWFDDWAWGWPIRDVLPSVLSVMGGLSVALAVAGFVAGAGLLERRPWARSLAIGLGVLVLLDPLLGTALGIYTLWVLLPSESQEEWRRIARPA